MYKNTQSLPPTLGKQALRFTSGSFAYCYFQLHYINSGFLFALRAKKGKFEHNRVGVHFGSCFGVADRAANPSKILLIFTHKITSSIAFALRNDVWLYRRLI